MPVCDSDPGSHTGNPPVRAKAILFYSDHYRNSCMERWFSCFRISSDRRRYSDRKESIRKEGNPSGNTYARIKYTWKIEVWAAFSSEIRYYGAIFHTAFSGMPASCVKHAALRLWQGVHEWAEIFVSRCIWILGGRSGTFISQRICMDTM